MVKIENCKVTLAQLGMVAGSYPRWTDDRPSQVQGGPTASARTSTSQSGFTSRPSMVYLRKPKNMPGTESRRSWPPRAVQWAGRRAEAGRRLFA